MTTSAKNEVKLPAWLREAVDDIEPTNDVLDRREKPRAIARLLINARLDDHSNGIPFSAKLRDVSQHGIGFIAQIPFAPGELISLTPVDDSEQPVHVSVVHCTETREGYLIGCVIVPA